MMKKFKLPIIKTPLPEPKILSMDDYVRFVEFKLKYTFDRKAYKKWRKMSAVNVPFRFK